MPRKLRPTKDPEAVALGVLALRAFAKNTPPSTPFEKEVFRVLNDLDVSPAVAQRLVSNFDKIRPKVRLRALGPLGLSDAQLPENVERRKRMQNPVVSRDVLRPSAALLPKGPGNIGLPVPSEELLAPERYTISYQGLHCVDETGIDISGSDEIYVITSAVHITPDGKNTVTTVRHPLTANGTGWYGDVDSHDTRIGPVASSWSALVENIAQGMSITTVVMEHDSGDPDKYRDEVDKAVKLAIAISSYLYPPAGGILALIELSGLVTDFFNWLLGTGDNEVGTVTTVIELSELEVYSRTRLNDFSPLRGGQQVKTGLRQHFLAPVNDNDYFVGFRVTRVPKAPLLPLPRVE